MTPPFTTAQGDAGPHKELRLILRIPEWESYRIPLMGAIATHTVAWPLTSRATCRWNPARPGSAGCGGGGEDGEWGGKDGDPQRMPPHTSHRQFRAAPAGRRDYFLSDGPRVSYGLGPLGQVISPRCIFAPSAPISAVGWVGIGRGRGDTRRDGSPAGPSGTWDTTGPTIISSEPGSTQRGLPMGGTICQCATDTWLDGQADRL